MNNDVMSEILLCLPVQSLMRFRAVCKTWGNLIDSQRFQKLHTRNNDNNKSDDMVYLQLTHSNEQDKMCLQVTFLDVGHRLQKELSINLQYNWNSLRLANAVKGLICIYTNSTNFMPPIVICNPFLGQLKFFPLKASSPSNATCEILWREVAIGFDEDYKVVQLLSCDQHLHAQVYSKSTDSWRELADVVIEDLGFYFVIPIKSGCKNGYFVHWYVYVLKVGGDVVQKILSFDMKNEVFRGITLPKDYSHIYNIVSHTICNIFAEDEHSFRLFDFLSRGSDNLVSIYESRCEGSELSWNHVMNVQVPLSGSELPLSRTCCVFFMHQSGVFVYDYSARKFICKHSVSEVICMDEIVEYKGSFVSL